MTFLKNREGNDFIFTKKFDEIIFPLAWHRNHHKFFNKSQLDNVFVEYIDLGLIKIISEVD